ncbi:MAG: acyltransferase [Caulobacteraceae bacterium]|nr:acyltransferase [Caulobacteraceae bacterium]
MSRAADRRMFYTIDGLRGIAALLVVCRHIVPLHGGRLNFQSSYLAVELFFLFSGFVIAHAYDRRFEAGLRFWEFVKVRLIRLWPLYFLGFAIAVLTVPAARLAGIKTWPLDPAVIIPGLFILPITVKFAGGLLYPFNNPSWTLFFELVANFAYALVVKHLTNRRLAVLLLVSAAALAWTAFHFHSLDVGYNRSHFIGGFGRVFFSFFAGVAVYRYQAEHPCPVRISPWILMLVLVFLLTTTIPRGMDRELYDTVCALVVFPLFAYLATAVEPGPRGQKLFVLGGGVSYALYLIHAPLGGALNQVFAIYGHPKGSVALGVAFIAGASLIAWLAEKYYDRPVRRWLTARTKPKAPPAPIGASEPVKVAKSA